MTDSTRINRSKFFDYRNNRLYEQIQGNQFVYLEDDKKTVRRIEAIETERFVVYPIEDKATEIGAIKLPYTASEYSDSLKLQRDIENHIYKYLDVSDRFQKMCSWFILMSWVTDKLNTVNYLRCLGDYGVGKSRFFNTVGHLCYKPIPFAGAITPAPLYRLMDIWNGTLILDECVIPYSDKSSDIIQILNSGIEKHRYVWRCDENNNPVPFYPFGPKVIASRTKFTDKALDSRCITENIKRTKRKDIPIDLPPDFYTEQVELRNQLLMFRLRNWNVVSGDYIKKIQLPDVDNRLKQMMLPFAITFYTFPKITEELNDFIIQYDAEHIENNAESLQGGIVYAICNLYLEKKQEQISSKDILDEMKNLGIEVAQISDVKIGKERKGLGIDAKQTTYLGTSKMSIIWDDENMTSLIKKYVTKDKQNYFLDLIETKNTKKEINTKVDDEIWYI
jgi:hypothetical protein